MTSTRPNFKSSSLAPSSVTSDSSTASSARPALAVISASTKQERHSYGSHANDHSSSSSSSTSRSKYESAVSTGSGVVMSTPASFNRSSGHFEQPPFRKER